MNGQIQYESRGTLTSGTTSADRPLAAGAASADTEFVRRLGQFRHDVRRLASPPARAELQRLVDMARELHLEDTTISDELAEIRASFEALDLADQIARGDLPFVVSLEPLPQGEACHFVTPVRFGRRRNDQFGHLELTTSWLRFHGALDVSVVWPAIANVQRTGRDVIVSLVDSRRLFRFCCHAVTEAARAAVVAAYLANVARVREADSGNPQPAAL